MFSGLTNQFTSLVGAVKGGQADEDVPAPPADAATSEAPATVGVEQDVSAAAMSGEQPVDAEEGTKRSSQTLVDTWVSEATGWLGSAKGWLGSASASIPSMPAMPAMPSMPAMPAMPSIPSIPGLRKTGGEEGAAGEGVAGENIDDVGVVSGEDDDKSSATEGADSHPASGGGTPTGDEGQIGQGKGEDVKITTKVTQQAKHFGSFLSSAINKAGAKIKETVKENPILDSFNKEQEAFIKSQSGLDSGAAPWIGHANEAKIKEEILGLAQDRRNFVRAPPAGVDFEFNYDTAYPTAVAIMAEDKALETMRFELVPKIITEENFWRNYFYRVSLIIQAAELGTLGEDGVGQASSGEDVIKANSNDKNDQKDKTQTDTNAESKSESETVPKAEIVTKQPSLQLPKEEISGKVKTLSESEFVSETFQMSPETDLEEIKSGMRKLGIDSMTQQALSNDDEEQWEKDLEAELKDYEVVEEEIVITTPSKRSGSKKSDKRGSSKKKGSRVSVSGSNIVEAATNQDDDDELPTISNLRTRSTNNDWEEMADLIEDTDDLK